MKTENTKGEVEKKAPRSLATLLCTINNMNNIAVTLIQAVEKLSI